MPITNEELTPILAQEDPEFQALTKRFDPKCWARYDLSAARVGYHYGRKPLLAQIAELKQQIEDGRQRLENLRGAARREIEAVKVERDTTATDLRDENDRLRGALADARSGFGEIEGANAMDRHICRQLSEQINRVLGE